MSYGADLNAWDNDGQLPIDLARSSNTNTTKTGKYNNFPPLLIDLLLLLFKLPSKKLFD